MNFLHSSSHQNKSLYLNNNNLEMDKQTTSCTSKLAEDRSNEEFQNFNDEEGSDPSEDEFVNSYDDLPVSEDDDVQLSSPSNSLNSDVDQRWYAFRGRHNPDNNQNDINNRPDNQLIPEINPVPPQQPQEEEETDFLEMDFEPDTNSEIENEAKFSDYVLPIGHQSNINTFNFHNHQLPMAQPEFRLNMVALPLATNEPESFIRPANRNTGAKPKQLSALSRPQRPSRQISDGDDVFKISSTISNSNSSSCHSYSSRVFNATNGDVYNIGASGSRSSNFSSPSLDTFMKVHKSPSKSSTHNNKQLRLQEEQNDQFLFEIEPMPRNSVTIYTSNCDEKILIDALTSLNLEPNREIIASYFNRAKPATLTGSGVASNQCELNLVDFIIYRSKLHCNYLKLIELIKKSCKIEDEEAYGDKKFDINFYPLDLFSTTPEMVEVPVEEIVQRWNPQTDLTPLVNIRNKYFYQTNVLGKIVNIIRRLNQNPPATFKDKETIKIPQFYVSGYVTITMTGCKPS